MIQNPENHKIETLQQELLSYKENMKIFVQKVEREISILISKYQSQLNRLGQQNEQLRRQLPKEKIDELEQLLRSTGFQSVSPIKKNSSKMFNEMSSTMFFTPDKFPTVKPMFDLQNQSSENSNYEDLSRSRFEVDKNRNKQKQQDLLQSLQSGKNNLTLNTSKMFTLLGKAKKVESEDEQEEMENEGAQSLTNKSDPMNSSLSSICESLDNSFCAKKSRQKNEKKKKEKEKARNQKLERLRESQKMRKQQGLKNLLKTMRQNVKAPGNKATELVQSSKLLTAGDNSPTKLRSKPKVMINPVAVDISHRSRNNTSFNSSASPNKSILKQSSTILTKSIMLGSNAAVSFNN